MKFCQLVPILAVAAMPAMANVNIDSPQGMEQVEHYKSMAYQTMSDNYSSYATLFNQCQQTPKAEVCGEQYEQATSDYQVAKARHDIFDILVESRNFRAPLPQSAQQELASALHALGYLPSSKASDTELLDAVNLWNEQHNFEKAPSLTLVQLSMIQAERFSQ